jgi:hypothetical protein
MSKIAIFYHTCQLPGWQDLFNEQIGLLVKTKLMHAADFVCIGINNGTTIPDFPEYPELKRPNVMYKFNTEQHLEEGATMKTLLEFANAHDGYRILYFHMKGITKLNSNPVTDWRNMMSHYLIENWVKCLKILPKYDAVGTNYIDHYWGGYDPHYSGTFWWTTSEYIRTLNHSYLDDPNRNKREFWIGSNHGSKLHSVHDSGLQPKWYGGPSQYFTEYPREKWTEFIE